MLTCMCYSEYLKSGVSVLIHFTSHYHPMRVCWCVGMIVCWCDGVLVCWCDSVRVCWCEGVRCDDVLV